MNYIYLLQHKQLFPSAIGITYKQFELLLPKFSTALRLAEQKKADEKKRLRIPGGGRKARLRTDRQKLFFIFFYYKIYPTFRFAQIIFEMHASNIYRWQEFLSPVLFEALGYQLKLPIVRVKHLHHWLEISPQLKEFIVDATERPVNRPKNSRKQKDYYSGKKKRHTVKNQLIINPKNKKILAVSGTVAGKIHDKKLLEEDKIILRAPPHSLALGDLGYQGADGLHPWIRFVTPLKKPPKKELSQTDKKTNKAISSIRVRVEHPFSYLKHFAVLAHQFRNNLKKAHLPFITLACLYNFTRNHRY